MSSFDELYEITFFILFVISVIGLLALLWIPFSFLFDIELTRSSLGSTFNLVGAMFVMIGIYFYFQYRKASSSGHKRVNRQRSTAVFLVFLLFAYATTMYFPQTGAWTVAIGQTLQSYFNQMSLAFTIDQNTPMLSPTDQFLRFLRFLGLAGYLILFAVLSITVKIPAELFKAVRQRL